MAQSYSQALGSLLVTFYDLRVEVFETASTRDCRDVFAAALYENYGVADHIENTIFYFRLHIADVT
jgi:hypothetical protein